MTIPGGQSSDEDDDDNATLTDQDLFHTLVPQGRARRGSAAAPRPADTPDHTANNDDRSGTTETPHDNDQPAPPETTRGNDQLASPETARDDDRPARPETAS